VKASICIATFRKPGHLRKVLESIRRQSPPFPYEVIVCDDGSDDETPLVAGEYADLVLRIDRGPDPPYRNPASARNAAAKAAEGEILICQSDDVAHFTPDAIERLAQVEPGEFHLATVYNVDPLTREPVERPAYELVSPRRPRPFFFLGSVRRRDFCAVGGNDEDFQAPGFEDNWLADCLIRGAGLQPVYCADVIGHHLHHERPRRLAAMVRPSERLYEEKVRQATAGLIPWQASGGPWEFVE
jgi:glycosyltransferase involved in cell wall biosynthesis